MELIKWYASNKKLPYLRVKIVQNLELAELNFAKILYIHKKIAKLRQSCDSFCVHNL